MHKRFTWDDGEAAEKWRIQEARTIIASVTITPRENITVRAYVNLKSDRISEPTYRPTMTVMDDAMMQAELLAMAKSELGSIRRKYAMLTELAKVWSAIDEAAS